MAKKVSIGAGIALDGEKEFRQAVSAINSDMKVLTSEMKLSSQSFSDNANSISALSAKDDILNKQLDKQKEKVEALKLALENSKKEYGENDTKTDAWKISLNNAEGELSKLDKELKTNEKYLDEAKKSTSGTAKSIDEFGKEVKEASDKTLSFGDVLKANLASQAIISGIKTLGSAIKNVAEGAVDLATGAATYADDMITMSTQTGVATDKLQAYNYMSELTDVSLEDMTSSMTKNIKSMSNAQKGTEDYVNAYKNLGIDIEDGNGNLRDSEAVYWDVIDALGEMTNETERDALSMQLFGKSAQDLNPLITIGSEGVAKFAREAKQMGAILDEDALTSLGETDDAMQRLTQAVDIAKREFGTAMAPAITEAADKITDKVTNMDGKFADFAGGALSSAVDGLSWIADNAGIIAGGVGGIAAGMAAFKAGSAIQTGLSLAVKAWQAYKVANEGATVAQWAMNLAQSASPVGLIATAVGVLVAGLIIYKATTEDVKTETDLLNDELSENLKTYNDLNESVAKNAKARGEDTTSVESEYGAIQILSDKLFNLSEEENLSNGEKAEMSALVDELNTAIPDLNLNIDKQTGALNLQRDEVNKIIAANLELYKVQAAQEDLTQIAKDQYEAEKTLTQSKKDRATAQGQLNKLEGEYATILEQGRTAGIGNNQETRERTIQMFTLSEGMTALKTTIGEFDTQIATTSGTIEDLGAEWNTTTGYIGDHTAIDETADATEQLAIKSAETLAALDTALAESEIAYADAKAAAIDSIQGQINIFDEFSKETEITKEELLANLKSQAEGVSAWADNLASLSNRGINEGLLADLKQMGPSAAAEIALLNSMSDKELQEYSKTWEELGLATVKGAEVVTADSKAVYDLAYAEQQTASLAAGAASADSFDAGIDSKENESKINFKSLLTNVLNFAKNGTSSDSESAGKSIVDGITKGINGTEGKTKLNNSVGALANLALSSFIKLLGINSPSKKFMDASEWIPEGIASGIEANSVVATDAMAALSDSLTLGTNFSNGLANIEISSGLPQNFDGVIDSNGLSTGNIDNGSIMNVVTNAVADAIGKLRIEIPFTTTNEELARAVLTGQNSINRRANPALT